MPCTCDFAHESSRSVNTCKMRVNARSSQGAFVIVIGFCNNCQISSTVLLCAIICILIHMYFSLQGNHAFEKSEEK